MVSTHGPSITIATLCSGGDLIMHCLALLSNFWLDEWGVTIRFEHLWSCEIDPWTRQFILDHHPNVPNVFCDVLDLVKPKAFCDKEKREVVVRRVQGAGAGFECDSVSSLNRSAKDNRDVIGKAGATDKTGSTGNAVLAWVLMFLPLFAWLENVKGLMSKGANGVHVELC